MCKVKLDSYVQKDEFVCRSCFTWKKDKSLSRKNNIRLS